MAKLRSPYPWIGRCLYCPSTGPGLTAEHIVPKMLDGKRQLLGASCRDCQEITAKLEGYVGRKVLGIFRAARGIYTRRPNERPMEAPLRVRVEGELQDVMVPIAGHPAPVHLPHLPKPDFFTSIDTEKDDWGQFESGVYFRELNAPNLPSDVTVRFDVTYQDFVQLARAIAKIAHCHVVDKLGITGFEHCLPDFIKGRHDRGWEFVGAIPGRHRPGKEAYTVGHTYLRRESKQYVVAYVRLFGDIGSEIGTPIFVIVAGKVLPAAKGNAQAKVSHETFDSLAGEILNVVR